MAKEEEGVKETQNPGQTSFDAGCKSWAPDFREEEDGTTHHPLPALHPLLNGARLEMAVCKNEDNRCRQHAKALLRDTPMPSLGHCNHQGSPTGRRELLSYFL